VYHNVTRKSREPDPPEPSDPEKKEKVIHTRVPERLEHELRERAQDLGISVSNLVRNVLGHAFGLVGDIMADGASVARAARGEQRPRAPAAPAPPTNETIGWQPLVMGKNAVCGTCNAIIPRGTDAAIAIVDGPGPRPVVCSTCFEELRHDQRSDGDDGPDAVVGDDADDGDDRDRSRDKPKRR
jgi:hypothetical protein